MGGKRLLMISDIRGVALKFDKGNDQDMQWRFVQSLRPVSSLLKFIVLDTWAQFYDYAPGVILKQVFMNYLSPEMRLMIDGVPEHTTRYNVWEVFKQMQFHHEHLRGQVYETTRPRNCTACLYSCFDCTVLWETLSHYANQSKVDLDII